MTELNQALVDIRSIRRQVAQTTEFRGYGPTTLSATAVLALVAGAAQFRWVSDPATHLAAYIAVWLTTGFICAALIATQMLTRANRLHSGMADAMIRLAVAQFLPAAVTGVLLPFVLLRVARCLLDVARALADCVQSRCLRVVPQSAEADALAGAWFLATGFACVLLGNARALAPVTMSGAYGIGMALVAAIHYRYGKEVSADEDETSQA